MKNKYELYYQIWYTHSRRGEKLEDPHPFWLYYGRYGTYDGALESLRTNRQWVERLEDTGCGIAKIRNSDDGGVSFY